MKQRSLKPIHVGLLGIGTVGSGTWDVLLRNASEIERRAGRGIRISRVADKDLARVRKIVGTKAKITPDAYEVVRAKGLSFATVLKEAQKRGYAETDPTFDIEGVDAAHKLTILSALAFGIPMQFSKAYTEGISKLTQEDIRYAEELGYRIKLLGITKKTR